MGVIYVPCSSTLLYAMRGGPMTRFPGHGVMAFAVLWRGGAGGGQRIRVNKSVSTRRVHLAMPCPSSDTERPPGRRPPPRPQNYHTSPYPVRTHAHSRPHAMSTTHITIHNTISSDTTTSFIAGYAPRPYASGRIMRRIHRRAL